MSADISQPKVITNEDVETPGPGMVFQSKYARLVARATYHLDEKSVKRMLALTERLFEVLSGQEVREVVSASSYVCCAVLATAEQAAKQHKTSQEAK